VDETRREASSQLASIERAIERAGLAPRGALRLNDAERVGALAPFRTLVLVGMIGARNWGAFEQSPEAGDGAPDPLDRWSRRHLDSIARLVGAEAIYPFGGPPYWPFLGWATRAKPLWPSPLGMLIHKEYGLWHSYRGALALPEDFAPASAPAGERPCDTCSERPCMNACPVRAFTTEGYDVGRCRAHLRSQDGSECVEGGCLARRACPVGTVYAHGARQTRFHMRAFLASDPAGP
jgi:ferredoxin-like protein FixX